MTPYENQAKLFEYIVNQMGILDNPPTQSISKQDKLRVSNILILGSETLRSHLSETLSAVGVGSIKSGNSDVESLKSFFPAIDSHRLDVALDFDLIIYCITSSNPDNGSYINNLCQHYKLPLLFYRQNSYEYEIGPLIVPGETACYECYQMRLRATGFTSANLDCGSINIPLGTDWLIMDSVKFLTGILPSMLYSRVLRFSFFQSVPSLHPILRMPRCVVCGSGLRSPTKKLWEE